MNMKFRQRLIASYAILALAASFCVGIVYNYYFNERYKASIYNNIHFSSNQILNKLDGELNKMEQVTLSLLSDLEVVQTIRDLSKKMGDSAGNELDVNTGKRIIKNAVYTAYNLENFYRVIVFNQYGYIGASATMQERLVNTEVEVGTIPWLDQAKNTKGRNVLISLHEDDWAAGKTRRTVFSLVREIQGNELGYIEVQQTEEYLAEIFSLPDENIKVIAVKNNGELLFASKGTDPLDYTQYFSMEEQISERKNEKTGLSEIVSSEISGESGVKLFLIEDCKAAMSVAPSGLETSLTIGGLFLIISLSFIVMMANLLTRPLQELRSKMEHTQWSNMTDKIEIKSRDADIQTLTNAYQDLLNRLSSSIEKEKKLSLLQLQAQFDALQAQINPHFLYNVLNVISNRGIIDDDETICEICGHLASMLRYSTNTRTRYATISEELYYTEQYIYLIKARYEDKIEFHVQMEQHMEKQIVPKTVLQQIVENCINHGFENTTGQMKIYVRGYEKDDRWYLEVSDNGQGFSENSLHILSEKMEMTRKRLFKERNNIELEIGGMGLINTYARLLLIYSDSLTFELKNGSDGAVVIFGANISKEENDVSGSCGR